MGEGTVSFFDYRGRRGRAGPLSVTRSQTPRKEGRVSEDGQKGYKRSQSRRITRRKGLGRRRSRKRPQMVLFRGPC